jgi:actin-related protein
MEKIWSFTFKALGKKPDELEGVVLTEPPCNTESNREGMVQCMFETFRVK